MRERAAGAAASYDGLVRSGDADAAVATIAGELARCSPQGLRESKLLLTHGLLERFTQDRDRVAEQSSRLFSSEEAREGMSAFLERRPPRWATP